MKKNEIETYDFANRSPTYAGYCRREKNSRQYMKKSAPICNDFAATIVREQVTRNMRAEATLPLFEEDISHHPDSEFLRGTRERLKIFF